MSSTAEINFLTTSFVRDCFRELQNLGFEFSKLHALQTVISADNLRNLQKQVVELESLPEQVRSDIPCLAVLKDFIHLVRFLKSLHSLKPEKENISMSTRNGATTSKGVTFSAAVEPMI